MWEFVAGYFAGCFTMLILARLISHETMKTHEIKPIAARRIDWQVNPIARLHQIKVSGRHHKEMLEALGAECCQIIAGDSGELTEDEEDIARSIVEHDCEVERVLRELL